MNIKNITLNTIFFSILIHICLSHDYNFLIKPNRCVYQFENCTGETIYANYENVGQKMCNFENLYDVSVYHVKLANTCKNYILFSKLQLYIIIFVELFVIIMLTIMFTFYFVYTIKKDEDSSSSSF